jgi:hypothetical protein
MVPWSGEGEGTLLTLSISAFSFGSKQITVNEIAPWIVIRRTARLTEVLRIEIIVIVDESNFIVRIVLETMKVINAFELEAHWCQHSTCICCWNSKKFEP